MPYLGSTLFIVVLVVAGLSSLAGYWLLVRALLPGFEGRARARASRHPILTLLLGAVVTFAWAFMCVLLFAVSHPITNVIGTVALCVGVALSFAGATAVATRVGQGLASPTDAGREWVQTLRGAIVLLLAALVPFIGWFVLLPATVLGGAGAALLGALPGRKIAAQPVPQSVPATQSAPHAPA